MAHFKMTPRDGGYRIELDGFDLTPHVLADGFSITDAGEPGKCLVAMKLLVDSLDVDLPDAVVAAEVLVREGGAQESFDR